MRYINLHFTYLRTYYRLCVQCTECVTESVEHYVFIPVHTMIVTAACNLRLILKCVAQSRHTSLNNDAASLCM